MDNKLFKAKPGMRIKKDQVRYCWEELPRYGATNDLEDFFSNSKKLRLGPGVPTSTLAAYMVQTKLFNF